MRYITKNLSCFSFNRKVTFSKTKKLCRLEIKSKAIIFVLSASVSTCTSTSTSTSTSNPINIMSKPYAMSDGVVGNANQSYSKTLWDGSEKNGYNSLSHPGYSLESNTENFTGGWHAHRKVWEDGDGDGEDDTKPADWIKEIIDDITKVDYQSMEIGRPPRILVLYGSLRPTSFSRKCGMFRPQNMFKRFIERKLRHSFVVLVCCFLSFFPSVFRFNENSMK